jgi:hypothetical protein
VRDATQAHRFALLVLAAQVRQRILKLHAPPECQDDRAPVAIDGDHVARPKHAPIPLRQHYRRSALRATNTMMEGRLIGRGRAVGYHAQKLEAQLPVRPQREAYVAADLGGRGELPERRGHSRRLDA